MPHECTNCGRTFPDGSKEMLSGCPNCGGNKFQFTPSTSRDTDGSKASTESTDAATGAQPPSTSGGTDTDGTDTSRSNSGRTDADAIDSGRTDADAIDSGRTDADDGTNGSDSVATDWVPATETTESKPASPREASPANHLEKSDVSDRAWPETARRPEDRTAGESEPSEPSSAQSDGSPSTQPDRSLSAQSDDSPSPSTSWTDSGSTTSDDSNRSEDRTATLAESEESAQADARSEIISKDDLPPVSERSSADRRNGEAGRGESTSTAGSTPDPSATPASTDSEEATDIASEGATEVDSSVDDAAEAESVSDSGDTPDHGRVVSEPSGDQPSIEELRAELNEQFESIKILSPGQYELNLMELYNREEYIISLQEDGRYVIDVPDSWRDAED
ncbi:Zn-ribbon containing protein [Natrarchaeobius sp. A-rgal3]|uniref:OapC/ArvC family zinc-ribbon domain-containing protein n=1 Tax=Natrarchaeobius versutus TaxID=1679078 RepID=UPI0035103096